jgi:hypothetical protein
MLTELVEYKRILIAEFPSSSAQRIVMSVGGRDYGIS